MPSWQSVREASLAQLSLAFGSVGGVIGTLVWLVEHNFVQAGFAVVVGLYAAAWVAATDAERRRRLAEDDRAGMSERVAAIQQELNRRTAFDVSATHGKRLVVWTRPGATEPEPTFWVVLTDVTITNRVEGTLPADLWLYVGPGGQSFRYGVRASLVPPPSWVADLLETELAGYQFLDGPINLTGRQSVRGYLAFHFVNGGAVKVGNQEDAKDLADGNGMWLQIQSMLDRSHKSFPFNQAARRADREGGPTLRLSTTDPISKHDP